MAPLRKGWNHHNANQWDMPEAVRDLMEKYTYHLWSTWPLHEGPTLEEAERVRWHLSTPYGLIQNHAVKWLQDEFSKGSKVAGDLLALVFAAFQNCQSIQITDQLQLQDIKTKVVVQNTCYKAVWDRLDHPSNKLKKSHPGKGINWALPYVRDLKTSQKEIYERARNDRRAMLYVKVSKLGHFPFACASLTSVSESHKQSSRN